MSDPRDPKTPDLSRPPYGLVVDHEPPDRMSVETWCLRTIDARTSEADAVADGWDLVRDLDNQVQAVSDQAQALMDSLRGEREEARNCAAGFLAALWQAGVVPHGSSIVPESEGVDKAREALTLFLFPEYDEVPVHG